MGSIFSIATMFVGILYLVYPVMEDIRFEEPMNLLAEYWIISYLTFGCMFLLASPLVFLVMLSSKTADTFKTSLYKSAIQ
jgi:hypothetical protein